MTLPLADMDACFDYAGISYVAVGRSNVDPTGAADWRTRGRPASTGPFTPCGVLCHHTASPAGTSTASDLNVILAGNGDAPGPISQLYISRDATLHLVAAGRANHGGKGRRPGVDVGGCADMNAVLIGVEVANSGVGEYWPDDQTELYAAVVAALAEWYGYATTDVYMHATTGPPSGGCNSKIDPAGPWSHQPDLVGSTTWDLATWRAFVDDQRAANVDPDPPAPSPAPTERRKAMADFVVIYGIPDVDDGTVLEVIGGRKRYVSGDEWWQVLKGVVADRDGVVPPHDPWQPVAIFTNGWYAMGLPNFDDDASAQLAVLDPPAS